MIAYIHAKTVDHGLDGSPNLLHKS